MARTPSAGCPANAPAIDAATNTNDVPHRSAGEQWLWQAFRQGEPWALELLYRRYQGGLTRFVRATTRRSSKHYVAHPSFSGQEIGDIVQEAFLRAFAPSTRLRFDDSRDFGAFLGQIARYVAIDAARAARRRAVEVSASQIEAPSPVEARTPEVAADVAEVRRRLMRLSATLRAAYDVLYVEGLSQRRAAERLGVGRQVLRTIHDRLKNELQV